jgi:hypothetical protein
VFQRSNEVLLDRRDDGELERLEHAFVVSISTVGAPSCRKQPSVKSFSIGSVSATTSAETTGAAKTAVIPNYYARPSGEDYDESAFEVFFDFVGDDVVDFMIESESVSSLDRYESCILTRRPSAESIAELPKAHFLDSSFASSERVDGTFASSAQAVVVRSSRPLLEPLGEYILDECYS